MGQVLLFVRMWETCQNLREIPCRSNLSASRLRSDGSAGSSECFLHMIVRIECDIVSAGHGGSVIGLARRGTDALFALRWADGDGLDGRFGMLRYH